MGLMCLALFVVIVSYVFVDFYVLLAHVFQGYIHGTCRTPNGK